MKAWERQEGETEKAYSAFKIYLEMPERSRGKVAKSLKKDQSLIGRWANKYDWERRAAAYDSSIFDSVRKANINSLKVSIQRKNNIASKLEEKALTALESLNLSRISGRTIVEMLTLSNQLRNEAAEIEQANDMSSRVTSITIKKFGE